MFIVMMQFLLLTSCLVLMFQRSEAMDQWGTEFVVAFFDPRYTVDHYYALYITARQAAAVVYVENLSHNVSQTVTVGRLSSARVTLTSELTYNAENKVEDKGVYVNATSAISVYSVSHASKTKGMFVVFPTKTLGKHYMMATYGTSSKNMFIVTALEDNTTVQVDFQVTGSTSCLNSAYTNGSRVTVTLNRHQTWGGSCDNSFLGSEVTSDRPVSVTSGLTCGEVPDGASACDYMAESMIPLEDLGTVHILHDVSYRQSGVIYRVISPYDNNIISDSGGNRTLNQGDFFDLDVSRNGAVDDEQCIESSLPVMVLMFTKGLSQDTVSYGDPAMSIVPAVQRFTQDYVINMAIGPERAKRYVTITVATNASRGMVLPEDASFLAIGCGYSVGHVQLDSGSHWLRHSSGALFGASIYAFGYRHGVATTAGMSLMDKFDYCVSGPCQNEGICSSDSNRSTHICDCPAGFNGRECQINIDDCLPDPCLNGAICVDGVNEYKCTCLPGYSGTHCETDINDCIPDPCQNGASCVDRINEYSCTCLPGYNGTQCERNIDDCLTNPCQNNASCIDGVNEYSCTCQPGYNGTQCEIMMQSPTTQSPTTQAPTTQAPTTQAPTSQAQTTQAQTTQAPTAQAQTTQAPTTQAPTAQAQTTQAQTTQAQTTQAPTAQAQTTQAPTTQAPTAQAQTTQVQTTQAPTTQAVQTPPLSKIPRCWCAFQKQTTLQEDSKQEAEAAIEKIKVELTVDKTGLSSTKRRLTSSADDRTSATNMGVVAVTFLLLVFGSILLLDLTDLCRRMVNNQVERPLSARQ